MSTTMLPGTMGSSLTGSGSSGGGPCPYTTPTNPYMYHHRTTAEPGTAMSSSIATLRLKAKQHSSGFSSPYSTQSSSISPVSRSNSGGLSACQYAGVTDSVWDNALVGSLLTQTSSLNHLLNNEHELSYDHHHREGHHNHQDASNGTNAVITDDEDCTTARNGNGVINDDIAD